MKFKAKAKDHQLVIKAKASFRETIDEKELDRFSRAFLRGFFKPKMKKKRLIEYTGPIGISLSERLKRPATKREFLFILEQTAVCVQKLNANNLDIRCMLMNLDYVYINEVTKELQFMYIPTTGILPTLELREFIEAVAYSVNPADENDKEFISRFVYYLNAMKSFDISKIEAFVLKEDKSVVDTIRRQNVGQSGYMTSSHQHYYERMEQQSSEEPTMLLYEEEEDSTALLFEEDSTALLEADDNATALLEDDNSTALLTEDDDGSDETGLLIENNQSVGFPVLYRILTEERISINKPVFRLGKEKSYVDYFVNNNIAVSRSHADIITRGDKCFVKDLNSKNHTFINNQEIPIHMEVEIHDGDRLKLGNEEFIFYAR